MSIDNAGSAASNPSNIVKADEFVLIVVLEPARRPEATNSTTPHFGPAASPADRIAFLLNHLHPASEVYSET